MKKYLIITICALLLVTGCTNEPKLQDGKEVIASLDGVSYTVEDLYAKLKETYGVNTLIEMIDNYITEKETNDTIKSDAKAYGESQLKLYKQYYGDSFSNFLSSNGLTSDEDFSKRLNDDFEKNQIMMKYIKENEIKEDDINEYYEKNVYGENTVRHILIEPETTDTMTDDEKKTAKENALNKAKEIITTLNASTDLENDFIKLAKEKSNDTGSKDEGGLISNFTNESGLATEFFEASVKLEVGKFTLEPVETQFGYHIIYKVSQNEKPSLENVKEKVLDKLAEEKVNANENSKYVYWGKLREKYNMSINDDIIKSSYNASMASVNK